MRLRDELLDPLGLMFAGIAGGVVAATGAAALVAAGVGAGVYVTKVVAGLLTDRPARVPETRVLPVTGGSAEEAWLRRDEAAERSFGEVSESISAGPISELVRSFGRQSNAALGAIRRVAGQTSAVTAVLARIDVRRCITERDQLRAALNQPADGRVHRERERAVAALQSQIDTYGRLSDARAALIARLEAGTIGLEGLVARLAEVVALDATSSVAVDGAAQIESLAYELEGLRRGLVEAETVTEQALGELDVPDPGTVGRRESRRAR
jgi:hypothetical protein